MKACGHCGSTERDSNGQCRCRNTIYRATRGAAKATADKARRFYDSALKASKGDVVKALQGTREEFPSPAPARKAPADRKPKAERKTPAQKKAATKKAEEIIEDARKAVAEKAEPERYLLVVDDFEEHRLARKDAAIKRGIKSGQPWTVFYKGKVVAASDDLL
jgi:hypothetical protein